MIVPFSVIRDFKLCSDAEDMSLTDMSFSPSTGRATHVICDRGGMLFGSEVAVVARKLSQLDPGAKQWRAELTSEEIADATEDEEVSALPLEALPPVVVGPFGSTLSPLMMAAQLVGLSNGTTEVSLPESTERMGEWLGAVVFGPRGPLATISDFHIDTERMEVREVSLRAGSQVHRLPFDSIRSFVANEGYAVVDLTEDDLRNGITAAPEGAPLPPLPRKRWVQRAA